MIFKPLISDALKSSLEEQIGHEKYNANAYLRIAAYLNSLGFDKIGNHFESQHSEETEHSIIIYNLLKDLGVDFIIPEVPICNEEFDTILDIANFYLERETLTTNDLDEIKNQAIDESNAVVEERIRDMIKLQQAEYSEATDFMDKATVLNEWWKVMLWNTSLT